MGKTEYIKCADCKTTKGVSNRAKHMMGTLWLCDACYKARETRSAALTLLADAEFVAKMTSETSFITAPTMIEAVARMKAAIRKSAGIEEGGASR